MADKPKSNGKSTTNSGRTPKAGPKKPGWRPAKKHMLTANNTLTAGVEQDRLNDEGTRLIDALRPVMVSIDPTADRSLKDALYAFVDTHTSVTWQTLRDDPKLSYLPMGARRHEYAIGVALKKLGPGRIRAYFISEVKKALRAVWQERDLVSA